MEILCGVETIKGNTFDHVLQLLAKIYGQKQTGRIWNQFWVKKLKAIGFVQSKIDECMFYRDNEVIFVVYVDGRIFLGQSDDQLTGIIKELMDTGLEVEVQGHSVIIWP